MNNVGVWFAITGICVSVFVIFVCIRFLFYLVSKRVEKRRMNKAIDNVMHRYCMNKMVRIEDKGDE